MNYQSEDLFSTQLNLEERKRRELIELTKADLIAKFGSLESFVANVEKQANGLAAHDKGTIMEICKVFGTVDDFISTMQKGTAFLADNERFTKALAEFDQYQRVENLSALYLRITLDMAKNADEITAAFGSVKQFLDDFDLMFSHFPNQPGLGIVAERLRKYRTEVLKLAA